MTTAVTVYRKHEITGNMNMEVVTGTFSDGYVYTTKFGTVDNVQLQSRSRAGAYASVSGQTITLVCASASGDTFDMIIIGH